MKRWFSFTPSTRIATLLLAAVWLASSVFLSGCTDGFFVEEDRPADRQTAYGPEAAPVSDRSAKFRHPQLLESAMSQTAAGKFAGEEDVHLFIGFNEYEADGITRRVLDKYGITLRILDEYGITRRVLDEYGITQRVLDEFGITQRVLDEFGGLTMELLVAYGITQRVLDEFGVTQEELEAQLASFETDFRLRVRIDNALPGITVSFGSDFLDEFLLAIVNDFDIAFVEPDTEMMGDTFVDRSRKKSKNQMTPWNLERIGGLSTAFNNQDVHVYMLDSGVYDRDLNLVEMKDFTMLFKNRDQETWDDSNIINMPVFDPGTAGDPVDHSGHGTHGAGTIGALDNTAGIVGVAPGVKLHSLKVLTDEGRTDITTVMAALDYVTDQKQQHPLTPMVVNLSLGMDIGTTAYNVLDEALKRATYFGVVVVVSAGNNGMDASTYSPAHVNEAITVGAYDHNNAFEAYSNYGPVVDLLAPGEMVVSLPHRATDADGGWNILMSGTSMAAPHVTGAAALYLALHPDESPAMVKQALINYGAATIGNLPAGTTDRSVYVADFAAEPSTGYDSCNANNVCDGTFELVETSWSEQHQELTLEGRGVPGSSVTFANPRNGEIFHTMSIDSSGEFWAWVTGLTDLPCSLIVESEGVTIEQAILNAPYDCDKALEVTTFNWHEATRIVEVGGAATRGTTIMLSNLDNGATILTTPVNDDQSWRFELDLSASLLPPCNVRVIAINGQSDHAVNASPCDPNFTYVEPTATTDAASSTNAYQNPYSWLEFTTASWDVRKKKLTLSGRGFYPMTVTLTNTNTGAELGTAATTSREKWKLTISNPVTVPCSVTAELDGRTAVLTVEKAPANCE